MINAAVIGVDLGTTGCKSMVYDQEGHLLAQSYEACTLITVDTNAIEQDANEWWRVVQKSICESVAKSGLAAEEIKGLCISSQGISFVPIGQTGQPLYQAISWLDTRADIQARQIRNLYTEEKIYSLTGKRLSPSYTLPKLMWIHDNLPEIYEQTYKFLMAQDFIAFKLTGQPMTDFSLASGTMAFNITTGKWESELLAACGIDMRKLPDVRPAGSVIGRIDPDLARRLGLSINLQVILGAQDQKCAALAAGVKQGVASVSLGTASAISTLCFHPVFDSMMRIPCFALGKDRWILESVIGTACISLKWMRDTFFPELDYPELDLLAAQSCPGANGLYFYPHLEGATSPYWRSDIRGFIYGLTLSTGKTDMIRAILEGIAYQIKVNILQQEAITGDLIREIRIFGGGSRSDYWCTLIANIIGRTVSQLDVAEIAASGAAMLARQGLAGRIDFNNLAMSDAAGSSSIRKRYLPDIHQNQQYQAIYDHYMAIQDKILV